MTPAHGTALFSFRIQAPETPARRIRIGCDLTAGDRRLGQQGEMLLTVR